MLDQTQKGKQVLADLKEISDQVGITVLLIGARARILIFDNKFSIDGRATTDWDIAIQIDSWAAFHDLSTLLTKGDNSKFKNGSVAHKFIHIKTEIEVDIVPFGKISQPDEQVCWGDGFQMNVMGLEEAFLSAQMQSIDEIEIRTVNLACFVVLKLFAWYDRRKLKDLEDIDFVLKNYSDDRVFDELSEELELKELELEDAAIVLLGRDIIQFFGSITLMEVDKIGSIILQEAERIIPGLISRMTLDQEWDTQYDEILHRFCILHQSLRSIPKSDVM